ncbi:LOW QUALITY PROTEIN: hypothetical protein RJ639_005749 [Escallonia herrerae]|uniref:Kinesin-like protein KIN-10A n=1 Tax=Escallonia herrerae TaxID=1293975 RepID=A0AA88VYG6_9ASTE|nr:LOW QUALITY PROTEIN: hypothetical protein RJ639_005749 [Escallonia herrerae]
MAPTPSSKQNQTNFGPKTPQSKHRLNFNNVTKPSPNPNSALKETLSTDHPVEVVGRIRDYPDRKEKFISALQVNLDRQSLRVRTDIGYRDFSLDGVSLSEEEDLDGFYRKFVESRINGVKLGDKCTVMMYGPTGSGKSHTMFGCGKQPGIVYKALRDILGSGDGEDGGCGGGGVGVVGGFVSVLEIYNEEIYDLLCTSSAGGGGFGIGWSKGSASKVKLEVMGKKAKNATFISGNEAGKISKEIQKVEKRRIVKSTLCNERSSRSHCMIVLDVPTVGGRLMLVDMAGSENIEQAGQTGLEAKMQTAKINQGNIALKRVVESIANGDSHVPFRDSKLTMLLQDSFEDDKSKILMILCASPDPKEMHKTISTLEYGAKAKCIVRGPHTPLKDKGAEDSSSAVILGSRIAAMDQFISKLQVENKVREKERNEAHKELTRKEEEVSALRAKLALLEGKGMGTSEEEINMKVNERTQMLKIELEKKIQECQKMADEFVEMERRKMEERIWQQQQELEMLRRRLEEIESELCRSKDEDVSGGTDGCSFAKRLLDMYADEDPGMEKSMDLDKSLDLEMGRRDGVLHKIDNSHTTNTSIEEDYNMFAPNLTNKPFLSTVFEEEEEEEKENSLDEEVQKEVIEEKRVCPNNLPDNSSPGFKFKTGSVLTPDFSSQKPERTEHKNAGSPLVGETENGKNAAAFRQIRIKNIFTLCGNHREISQHNRTPFPMKKRLENFDSPSSPVRTIPEDPSMRTPCNRISQLQNFSSDKPANKQNLTQNLNKIRVSDENYDPSGQSTGDLEVYVKWEVSKQNPGKVIATLKVAKDSTLADLRKLIEIYLGADNQAFTFLVLGDPSGASVPKEKEATMLASKLPICNNQVSGHLACLRPVKGGVKSSSHLPLSPLENLLPVTPNLCSPRSSTPFITVRRH